VNRAARASRPRGIDPSRKSRSCPPSQKRKTGPLCSSHLHKGPALSCLAAMPNGCKGHFISFGRGFVLRPGRDPEAQSLGRGYDYFFFFEVFLATFLVAAFAVFFAFFAFLAMSPSVKKNSLSEHAHAVDRHAQHREDITNAKLIPTHREVVLESLAGGTRSGPRRHCMPASLLTLLRLPFSPGHGLHQPTGLFLS
jgi:hypothetical protein